MQIFHATSQLHDPYTFFRREAAEMAMEQYTIANRWRMPADMFLVVAKADRESVVCIIEGGTIVGTLYAETVAEEASPYYQIWK